MCAWSLAHWTVHLQSHLQSRWKLQRTSGILELVHFLVGGHSGNEPVLFLGQIVRHYVDSLELGSPAKVPLIRNESASYNEGYANGRWQLLRRVDEVSFSTNFTFFGLCERTCFFLMTNVVAPANNNE